MPGFFMLSVMQLSKAFGTKQAVKAISFTVQAGEVFCMLGSNGAGKTTTVNLLLGFEKADSGAAELGGVDMLSNPARIRRQTMYIPENVQLYQSFTARENINYLAAVAGVSVTHDVIEQAVLQVGLDLAVLDQSVSSFSKGMRQKVAIAFAILKKAQLLILDEPTSGLDPQASRDFVATIENLKAGNAAVLIVTHDLQCALSLANHIGIMRDGSLLTSLPNQNLTLDQLEATYFQHMSPSVA